MRSKLSPLTLFFLILVISVPGCYQEASLETGTPDSESPTLDNESQNVPENQATQDNSSNNPPNNRSSSTQATTTQNKGSTGILEIYANGEDFVRQGFVSKDGWSIEFDQVEVHLGEIIAYQTKPAFEPEEVSSRLISIVQTESIAPQVVDLALGENDAEAIFLGQLTAPTGQYNAITWSIRSEKPDQNQATLKLVGTATKAGKTIQFDLNFAPLVSYECGEYVGEQRQGFVSSDTTGLLEITLHFDHLFGDGRLAANDELNVNAYGFAEFAQLAQDGKVTITPDNLTSQLDKTTIEKINVILSGLGHVGEGHCRVKG